MEDMNRKLIQANNSLQYQIGINGTISTQMNELMGILDIPQENRSFEKFRITLQKLKEAFKFIIKGEENVQMLLARATNDNNDKALEETKQKLQVG